VSLANALQIKLVFYHVKRRPQEDGTRLVFPPLAAYTAAFKAWVEAHGHYHINETDDANITLEMYNDGDHLHPQFYHAYTDMFAARVRQQIPLWPHPFPPQERAAIPPSKPSAKGK
jgi:hypothetical protein